MTASLLLDAEVKLASDRDGSYKARLIARMEKYRDEFAFSRQGFLPPEESEVAEGMEGALEAALTIIRSHEPTGKTGAAAEGGAGGSFNAIMNV